MNIVKKKTKSRHEKSEFSVLTQFITEIDAGCWCASEKIPVIGKRETFLFDFVLLTAWNNLERDRIPAGLARDGSLKGVKLANSELHQSGKKCGLTSKTIATLSISSYNQIV